MPRYEQARSENLHEAAAAEPEIIFHEVDLFGGLVDVDP